MTTVSKTNRMEIPGIIDEVVKAGANIFAFSRYVPSGGDLDASMTAQEYRELLAICDKKFKEYEAEGQETYFNKKDHLWTLYEYETGEFKIPDGTKKGMIYGGCNCGNVHITILPTGDIYACRRVGDSKVGNVFEDRIADVWVTSMEKYREFDKFSKCSKCKLMPWCRGCPAVAKGTNGSFYAADPQCWADENGELFNCQEAFMDAKTCIEKLRLVGVLDFATVDEDGAPQVRNISAIHFEGSDIYFLTARGKSFARQLYANGRVQILGYTRYKETIRVSGKAVEVPEEEQIKWRNVLYEEQPYLENVYPGETKNIDTMFVIKDYTIEYFCLSTRPITREYYGSVMQDLNPRDT